MLCTKEILQICKHKRGLQSLMKAKVNMLVKLTLVPAIQNGTPLWKLHISFSTLILNLWHSKIRKQMGTGGGKKKQDRF